MRVLFWNINGIVCDEAQTKLRELIKEFKPDIIGIAEQKVSVSSRSVRRFCIDGFSSSIIHNSTDTCIGNLWVIWSLSVVDPVVVNCSKQTIIVGVDGVHISLVHAISLQTSRRNLWRQLDMGALQVPWLTIGDFNCVLRNEEKKGGVTPRAAVVNEFCDWLDDNDLFESESLGCKYTWSNKQSGVHRIISRLDRAVINEFWLNRFENWRCKALPREVSDHSPIIGFLFVNTRPRRAPFRVQKMWFGHPDFMPMVENSWKELIVGSPAFIYPQNLKRLKRAMKLWNQEVFGNVNVRLKQAQLRLENSMRLSDEDPSDVDKLNLMRSVVVEVNDIRTQQVIMLKKKSRNQWLVEAASNFSFFHNFIRIRRSSNTISELVDANGVTVTDCDQIRNLIVDYYEAKFNGDDSVPVEALFNIDHNSISLEESDIMDQLPSINEIHAAVFDLGADSASGPDGFAGFFYSLLMLFPKDKGANTLRNFRQIGLSNFFFKIFTKILASRLGSVLDNLISEEQVSFMKWRNIHENIILSSEMANETQIKQKDGNVVLKLDIPRLLKRLVGYLSWRCFVDMDFLRVGDWILQILKPARISVLVNGSPEGFFSIDKGLRQGDPLSPLIFVLIEELLSRNITKLFREGKMTHMVNRKGNMKSLRNLVDLLGLYQRASGQTVSRQKSKLYYGGGSLNRRATISNFLGMPIVVFPDRYLGVKVMPGEIKYHHVANVVEKIKEQLAGIKWVYSLVEDNSKVLNGDGRNTSLYYDVWLGDVAIAELLEDFALDHAILVGGMMNEGGWNLSEDCRNTPLAAGFVDEDLPTPLNEVDRRIWKPNYTGSFTVNSAKSLIRKKYAKMEGVNLLWRPVVHPALAARN
ncbi:uncharacterized protein LOC113272344 [Papaver somniferum]|uniref:uncharacterized protein LOC113272344 n=1 Tax=Papaver somniferum TaxID=3469 RepID=UPI000E6FD1FC|nr:uncharacterized protein LOC113272344 [Papaver somniferum]